MSPRRANNILVIEGQPELKANHVYDVVLKGFTIDKKKHQLKLILENRDKDQYRDPFVLLLARWLINGLRLLARAVGWGIILAIGVAVLCFFGKILWTFIILIRNALGGF